MNCAQFPCQEYALLKLVEVELLGSANRRFKSAQLFVGPVALCFLETTLPVISAFRATLGRRHGLMTSLTLLKRNFPGFVGMQHRSRDFNSLTKDP